MRFSRRDLFRLAWLPSADARTACAPAPARPTFLRPPGALPEATFQALCTRCDACLVACPRESIRRAGHELGPLHEGTPVILPAEQPCWMCRDMPCITACEPGALRPLGAPEEIRMGRVLVREEACFSAQGNPCEVCAERCPARPRAARVTVGEAPEIDAERCTGCSVCAWLCPAQAMDVRR